MEQIGKKNYGCGFQSSYFHIRFTLFAPFNVRPYAKYYSAVFWRKVILVPKVISKIVNPKILKRKKYIKQSKNTNGSPLEPLYGLKKKKS